MRRPAKDRVTWMVCAWGLACTLVAVPAWAQNADTARIVQITAVRTARPPAINGELSDPAWREGVTASQFVQREPDEFAEPSQKSEVVILYDDNALYLGARLYDTAPDSIIARLARRDVDTGSDLFVVYLDPYHDHRSGFYFGLNAAGTRYDGVVYNDSWRDDTWEGVWDGAVARDSQGWSAEFRIPLSQLRYHDEPQQVWGINLRRLLARRQEYDFVSCMARNDNAFASRFADLHGIEGIPQAKNIELLPYGRGKAQYRSPDGGDPINKSAEYTPTAGMDMKMAIGSGLTLNATVNPDFGQVEVDPAVVNLSDVETYFDERRPFFIEGSKTFDFGSAGPTNWWGFNWSGLDLFYSRRIGRAPQRDLPDYDFVRLPEGAHILGAAKLTGKLRGNWNVGSLHAFTMRETGDLQYDGERRDIEVEPATYYTVTRVQKEIEGGFRGLGVIGTAAHRFFDDPTLKADINSDAYVGGLDGWTFLDKNRTYALGWWSGVSHVRGTPERITALQRSSRHYFQRPDASYVDVDSNATSLSGFTGRVLVNKEKGRTFLNTAIATISPGFDCNDLGFMYRAGMVNAHFGTGYRWAKTTSWTRYAEVIGATFGTLDYGGNVTGAGVWTGSWVQYANYWTSQLNVAAYPDRLSNTATRGGPLTVSKAAWELNANVSTDSRKNVILSAGTWSYTVARDDWNCGVWLTTEVKPAGNVSFSIGPELAWAKWWLQWVDAFDDPLATRTFGTRYVFSDIYQTELSSPIRLNWTFTPKLSLQLYAQPLISSGDYGAFRELTKPRSHEFYTYPEEDVRMEDGTYTIDPDGTGPAETYEFDDPDFDLRSLRGNVILRWEYLPGSTLYFVWTHGRTDDESRGWFDMERSLDRLFDANSENIVLVKATYWLSW